MATINLQQQLADCVEVIGEALEELQKMDVKTLIPEEVQEVAMALRTASFTLNALSAKVVKDGIGRHLENLEAVVDYKMAAANDR